MVTIHNRTLLIIGGGLAIVSGKIATECIAESAVNDWIDLNTALNGLRRMHT